MKGLKGREMKTLLLSTGLSEVKRASVVILAIIPMLVLLVFPIRAGENVAKVTVDDVAGLVGVKVGDWVKYSLSITGPVVWGGRIDIGTGLGLMCRTSQIPL